MPAIADRRGMHASSRGMRPTTESANRRGMFRTTRGMRAKSPGMGRTREPANRRGMRASAPGMRRALKTTDRRGMRVTTQGMRGVPESTERRGMGGDSKVPLSGSHVLGLPAQRVAVQLPQARHSKCQKANDLVRAAVGWNGGLGGLAHDARLLPA